MGDHAQDTVRRVLKEERGQLPAQDVFAQGALLF